MNYQIKLIQYRIFIDETTITADLKMLIFIKNNMPETHTGYIDLRLMAFRISVKIY
jgi:hypothetical protein